MLSQSNLQIAQIDQSVNSQKILQRVDLVYFILPFQQEIFIQSKLPLL